MYPEDDGPNRRDVSAYGLERPLCVALVLCDLIIEDKRTNNKTLVGVFSGIVTPHIPAVHPRMFVLASLTSGRGEWSFSVRITAPSGAEMMHMHDVARFTDPLVVHDLVIELRNLPLSEPGVHFVDLLLGDTPLAHRRFTVQVGEDRPTAA
jgi:hypothetical protein